MPPNEEGLFEAEVLRVARALYAKELDAFQGSTFLATRSATAFSSPTPW